MNPELNNAYKRIIQRIRLQDEIVSEFKELYEISSSDLNDVKKENLWINRVKHVEKQYELGHVTEAYYFYNVSYLIENIIHSNRWLNGYYDKELSKISKRINKIEYRYGLKEDEYWKKYDGPYRWQQLNKKYNEILRKKLLEIYDELQFTSIKNMLLKNKKKYNELVEKGRKEVFEKEQNVNFYNELLTQLKSEFKKCKEVHAYYSATIMTGSILELMLVKICQDRITQLKPVINFLNISRKRNITNNPLNWSLHELLLVAEKAEIFPLIEINSDISISIIDIGNIIRNGRNLIHPGNHIKSNFHILEENNFKDIDAFYEIINHIFVKIEKEIKN